MVWGFATHESSRTSELVVPDLHQTSVLILTVVNAVAPSHPPAPI